MTTEYQPIPLPDYEELPPAEMQRRADAFLAAMRRRRTVREFSAGRCRCRWKRRLPTAAGTSGANHQPWHFAVVEIPHARRASAPLPRRRSASSTRGRRAGMAGGLGPLGTDPDKAFLEVAPFLICIFGRARRTERRRRN